MLGRGNLVINKHPIGGGGVGVVILPVASFN